MPKQPKNCGKVYRRTFLADAGMGFTGLALGTMLHTDGVGGADGTDGAEDRRLETRGRPHFAPRAKNVIFLNMAGAPPHLDMFDYKPKLKEMSGQPAPLSVTGGERFAFIEPDANLLGPLYEFRQYGQAGMWMSTVVDPLWEIADDICMIHGVHTDEFNHSPASLKMFTGFPRSGRPSIGAWLNYGLGCEADDLPGFVVLASGRGARCGSECFGSGFLPSIYQGVMLRSEGEPGLYLENPPGIPRELRRDALDALKELNEAEFDALGDPEIQTRIAQYEMAFRMQASVPELADLNSEPASIHALYGTEPGKKSFANNCLLARRLIERGVRFVQLNHGEWDLHGGPRVNIPRDCPRLCRETMPAAVALVTDLKQRGLLKDTLVIWGAEFGRTPMLQGDSGPQVGRDHHKTFSMWLAGGGVKPGFVYGGTDEIGYKPLEGSMHVYDIQATILHLLGLDHERLTFKFQGRHFRLTDVHGEVHHSIIA